MGIAGGMERDFEERLGKGREEGERKREKKRERSREGKKEGRGSEEGEREGEWERRRMYTSVGAAAACVGTA